MDLSTVLPLLHHRSNLTSLMLQVKYPLGQRTFYLHLLP